MEWASYQIRKIAGCACAGNAGNVFPRRRFQRKLLVSDHGMHHGTCVKHVPWCMSGSLTCGDEGNVPGACAPAILLIWQEVDYTIWVSMYVQSDEALCFRYYMLVTRYEFQHNISFVCVWWSNFHDNNNRYFRMAYLTKFPQVWLCMHIPDDTSGNG